MGDLKPRNKAIVILNNIKEDLEIKNTVESLRIEAVEMAKIYQQGRIDSLCRYGIKSEYENEVLKEINKL